MKIDKKIKSYKVKTEEPVTESPLRDFMHEKVERPEVLVGSTYKIKTPQSDHALYVTINDVVFDQGTDRETRHPYEVFINTKNMENFQWVLAMTRLISAVFRKGGEFQFMLDELKEVIDPKGGRFHKGRFIPSLVAEIGEVIERHIKVGVPKNESK